MKNLWFIFLGLFFFLSCSAVRFENPQPIGNKELKKIPSKLTGHYVDQNGDTLILKSKSYILPYHDKRKFSSDSIVLKKYRGFYVLSSKGFLTGDDDDLDLKGWDVVLLKFINDSLKVFSIETHEEELLQIAVTKLRNILPVESVPDPVDDLAKYFLINPGRREFKEIIRRDIFSGIMEFKRVDD